LFVWRTGKNITLANKTALAALTLQHDALITNL